VKKLSLAVLALPLLAVLALPVLAVCAVAFGGGPAATDGSVDDIPARVAVAYRAAGGRCPGLDWTLLAAIGAVETDHGRHAGSTVDADTGEITPWIFGPPLDGTGGTAAISIGQWHAWWGLTGPWLHAVGPMQFLPTTFTAHAVDADGDGTANPHHIDDAVATAAAHICSAAGGQVDGPREIARIYNPGDADNYAAALTREQERIRDAGALALGDGLCPVAGTVTFADTWLAPRSGGRQHQGVDIFAAEGTPVVAPASGRVEHYDNSLGGLSYRLYADDGTFYYGTHLAGYANEGAGHVAAGTVIGYVGRTGNAATTPPHLHWEIHAGGRGSAAINPTPTVEALCAENKP
jgi:murein DD-endopeptidase MepM/ murein hydrolase activator NlpD